MDDSQSASCTISLKGITDTAVANIFASSRRAPEGAIFADPSNRSVAPATLETFTRTISRYKSDNSFPIRVWIKF